jgi:multidrug efflux pump subunit AcrA (membrane-fusion protein)
VRINSESVYDSQLKLYAAIKSADIARSNLERLADAAESGAIPRSRLIEIENEIARQTVTIESYRQDLKARGLPRQCIERAERGEFATEIVIHAPDDAPPASDEAHIPAADTDAFTFEIHSLAVELGQQVAAGQVVAHLADHRSLLIEARGFKDDLPAVQEAIKNGWEPSVEFDLPASGDWPELPAKFPIHHLANTVDPETRTFKFFLPLPNQSQSYQSAGVKRLLWRFRPGAQLRVRVPVEKFENVFVVPKQAVVWEGPEAYVFRQNGEFFDRRPVHVMYEDRLHAVLANDGSVKPGFYVAQSAAASLNRVLKAQASSGLPAGVHVHPDGTIHAAH